MEETIVEKLCSEYAELRKHRERFIQENNIVALKHVEERIAIVWEQLDHYDQ